jgi:hypothetical protein
MVWTVSAAGVSRGASVRASLGAAVHVAGAPAGRQIELALERFSRRFVSFGTTVQEAAGVANEGWKLLAATRGAGEKLPTRYPRSPSKTLIRSRCGCRAA